VFIGSAVAFAAEEGDITSQLVTDENNKAFLMFTIPVAGADSELDNWLDARDYARAHTVTSTPSGITEYITGQSNQFAGDSGFRFHLPTSLASSPDGRHAFVGFSANYNLKRDAIGAERFDALVTEAQRLYDKGESAGPWVTPHSPLFLNQYGVQVFMRFQDGEVRNITEEGFLMLGLNLADAANGNVLLNFGALAIDKDATDNSWHEPERISFSGESITLSFIYDGVADGNIDVTWWIADLPVSNNGGSSGGCNAMAFPGVLFLSASLLISRKIMKWKQGILG
jgi:hypothetical protein